jgi:hypothetical protein
MATYEAQMQNVSVSTGITLIQVLAGAAALDILRVEVSQGNSTLVAQNMQRFQILRKTAAATVTSFTPLKHDTLSTASLAIGGTAKTGTNASAEGTDGDVLVDVAFHVYMNYTWIPVPEERIRVPQGGIIAIKFPAAPANALNVNARIVWREYL